jgi:hypothetical protein
MIEHVFATLGPFPKLSSRWHIGFWKTFGPHPRLSAAQNRASFEDERVRARCKQNCFDG